MSGTMRMNSTEYESLRTLFGLCSEWERACETLERRFRSAKGGWRDARRVRTVSLSLMERVIDTIDKEQLGKILRDLKSTRVRVAVGQAAAKDPAYTYAPVEALRVIINAAVSGECMFCDKSDGAARTCPLRIALNKTIMHDLSPVDGCEYKRFGYRIGEEGLDDAKKEVSAG